MPITRKIIHIDADAFYAAIEIRDNPELRDHPLAVGGRPGGRGVVATCNYAARAFGVHSAMSAKQAQKLCPHLIFVRPRFAAYRECSQRMHEIFSHYTDLIEPLSLDEAYLDVSDSKLFQGSATLIAKDIQARIKQDLGITVSAGIAPNKFLAKVASDWQKPEGLFVLRPEQVSNFVRDLPVRKINGVGKVTAERLKRLGVELCADLQTIDFNLLIEKFGKYGQRLYELSFGRDDRPVQSERHRKSLSIENTFEQDLNTQSELLEKGQELYAQLIERSKKLDADTHIQKRFVKVKFTDFTQTTLEESLSASEHTWQNITSFERMLLKAWQRQGKPVRLLGLGVRLNEYKADVMQLDFFR
jgi:DNA polymerase-4